MENTLTKEKKSIIKTSFSVNFKCLGIALLLIVQIMMERLRPVSYIDELIGVAAIVLLAYYILKRRITPYDEKTVIILVAIVFIGLIGNLVYSINPSNYSIFIDVLTQIKVILSFFALRYLLSKREKQLVIDYLTPFSQLFIILEFILAIINLFINIGPNPEKRYGINVYRFFFLFVHQYTVCAILVLGIILCSSKLSKRAKQAYAVMGLLSILAALKSAALIFVIVFVLLYFYFQRYQQLSIKVILPAVALIIFAGSYQIQTYLLNENSARRVLLHYAIVDANTHFPLGSGFGTYGSAEAAKNYSSLYYLYDFPNKWGLSPDNKSFLHDNYWQTLLGQFGWFGFALFIWVYSRWLRTATNENAQPAKKALQYSIFVSMVVFAIGSAAISSSPGLIAFAGLALFSDPENIAKKGRQRIKIKI